MIRTQIKNLEYRNCNRSLKMFEEKNKCPSKSIYICISGLELPVEPEAVPGSEKILRRFQALWYEPGGPKDSQARPCPAVKPSYSLACVVSNV